MSEWKPQMANAIGTGIYEILARMKLDQVQMYDELTHFTGRLEDLDENESNECAEFYSILSNALDKIEECIEAKSSESHFVRSDKSVETSVKFSTRGLNTVGTKSIEKNTHKKFTGKPSRWRDDRIRSTRPVPPRRYGNNSPPRRPYRPDRRVYISHPSKSGGHRASHRHPHLHARTRKHR